MAGAACAWLPVMPRSASALTSANVPARIDAVSLDGSELSLERAAVIELAERMRGDLLVASSKGYDAARKVWNGMIDRSPALIARCAQASDVAAALSFAAERSLLVAVRAGGHSISGKGVCDRGLMIDLAAMNRVSVDRASSTARAQGGALEGDIDAATAPFALATTGGVVSHTGAGGLTLGGGFGRLCRRHGLACDNLIAAEIVTPDGSLRRVSDDQEPELMWALRGGGGNFGVVTALEYRLHEQNPTVIGGDVVFDWRDAKSALGYYAESGNELAEELNINVFLRRVPEIGPAVVVEAMWSGDPAKADAALAPLRRVAKPVTDTIGPVRYTEFQRRLDAANAHGSKQYMKSGFITDFSESLIDEFIDAYRDDPTYAIFLMQSGGAVNQRADDETAFPHRAAHSNVMVWHLWQNAETKDVEERRIAEVRSDWARLVRYTDGYYTNLNEEGARRTRRNYRGNFDRLVDIKRRFDPHNLLRLNTNINPDPT